MGDETLSTDELESLLENAEIISDDTGGYISQDDYEEDESSAEEVIETNQVASAPPAEVKKKAKPQELPTENVDVGNLTSQQKHNAELLLDIYVQVTVELGRTTIKVKDVLGLGEGSIVELGKPASEPVDLLVNNRLVARGEVVVIDENFGARVTNIVNPMERLANLKVQ